MLASLDHPHIGAIYGLEESDHIPALVLELVEGETLADRLQRGPLSVHDCLDVARQIADGLHAAHQKGIIHRDLKPANIKITPGGVVKVLDFGLAKAATSEDISTTLDLSQSSTMAPGATRAGVIPDGRWILGWTSQWFAFSLEGRPPVLIGSSVGLNWSPDGAWVTIAGGPVPVGGSYLMPLGPGEMLPRVPADGFKTEDEVARLPGARRVDAWMVPGPSPDVYAFYRTTTQRNLYRIPLP